MENESNNLTSMETPGSDDQGASPMYTPPPAPKVGGLFSKGNLLLMGLFAAALVGLYMIHVHSGAGSASAATKNTDAKMDSFLKTISELRKQGDKKVTVALDTTKFEARHRQVPLTDLHLNPFRYKPIENIGLPSEAATQPSDVVTSAAQDAAKKEVENALTKVKELKLQSIISGREPAALIDNNMVGVGQKIAGWTVVDIQPQQVKLTWRDQTHTLYLD